MADIANHLTLQITKSAFISHFLVTDLSDGDSSAPVLMSLPAGQTDNVLSCPCNTSARTVWNTPFPTVSVLLLVD
jgi:hypothetical protein